MTDESKTRQEAIVGRVLADAYQEVTGGPLLSVSHDVPDPPDLFFEWRGTAVGAEAFELHQFHDQRSVYEGIAAKAQSLIADRSDASAYVGVVVSLGRLTDSKGRGPIELAWRGRRIKRPIVKAAEELASALLDHFPSVAAIPDNDVGAQIKLDPSSQPSLHALAPSILVSRCGLSEDPTSVAWPRIVPSPGYTYDSEDMVRWVAEALTKKVKSKGRKGTSWQLVAHSILVAHDLPRDRLLRTHSMPWASYIEACISETDVMSEYDELWLVSFDDLHGRGVRICGNPPAR